MRPTSLFAAALVSLLAACSGTSEKTASQIGADSDGTDPAVGTTNLRIVASNLTSGNMQSYDPGDGARILQALKPDVALMQEFNYGTNSEADIRRFVDTNFGTDYSVFRENDKAQIPNGIVSRYPIKSGGVWKDPQTDTRGFAWAQIDIPGDKDLWAISVHLLTSSSSRRSAQTSAIVSQIHNVVPAGDYVTIGGDFNTGSRTEQCVRTLGSVFQVNGPFPADTHNNQNTSANRSKPEDWVLVSPPLDALHTPVVVGGLTFQNGLVFDSRNFGDLSKMAPVRSGDSGSSNMQHMAVVRDFALPVTHNEPAPAPQPDPAPTPDPAPEPSENGTPAQD